MKKDIQKSIKVLHSIPGRMRLKVKSVRSSPEWAYIIEHFVSKHSPVIKVEARPITGSVILFYDPERAAPDAIIDLLRKALTVSMDTPLSLSSSSKPACGLDCKVCHPVTSSIEKKSLLGRLVEVLALTAFMVYSFVKNFIFKSPLSQGPFTIVAGLAVVAAIPLFRHALDDLRQGKSMSLFPFLASTCVLALFLGETMTALEVIWILRVGMLLEDYVAERSRKAISEILQVAAKDTYVLIDGMEVEIPVDEVKEGDILAVHTGEKIPVDGVVLRGEAMVDEAHITGRAEPQIRKAKDRAFAGTIVQEGVIFIRAEKVGDETYLCRILHLVEDSLANRAPVEKQADILAARLFRLGVFATLAVLLLTADPLRAFTVMLVMACPCATVLAASTAVTAALANAARNHILVKGGLHLETVGKADCFCFDKTGTITAEIPQVIEVIPRAPKQTEAHVLALAAAAEMHNEHPMARAVVNASSSYGIIPEPHAVCEFVLGRGVKARMDGDMILVGNTRFLEEEGVSTAYYKGKAEKNISAGHTVLFVARNKKLQGMIVVGNTIRPNARAVLDWLRKDGVSALYLGTGDTESVAKFISDTLGFDGYRSDLMPEDKSEYIERLEDDGMSVVMIGDGVNDALALSKAGVGIAMGAGGAEVAIEASDIALVDSELERIVNLRQLSHKTLGVIEENYYLAVSTNIIGVLMGALGWLTPIMAGGLHIVHTLGILMNSSRLIVWEAPGLKEKEVNGVNLNDKDG